MKFRSLVALSITTLLSGTASAWPAGTTKEEIAVLPPYCAFTQGSKVPGAYAQMAAKYGEGWSHMHHYCYALVSINRLNRMAVSASGIPGTIRNAQSDLIYVIERTAHPFPWRPEIMVALARLQFRAAKQRDAVETAEALIAEWPEAADGYTVLAEILIKAGQGAAASKVLERADQKVTDKERLQRLKSILPTRQTPTRE